MFKNLIIYRIAPTWSAGLEVLEAALDKARFAECGATQEKSAGWVEPRGELHGPLAESVGGQWVLRYMVEVKAVPSSVLNRKARERAQQIEQAEGRKPGKKEMKELKEELKLSLLPMAFTKQASVPVWIDPQARLLLVDAGSQGRADEVVTALVKELDGFAVALLDTQVTPMAAMSQWLTTQELPDGLAIGQELELKAADESKAVVRYARHPLDIDEVKDHIAQGKLPTRLAMTWDDRIHFVLTEGFQLKKISFDEVVFEGQSSEDKGFDADVAIATGELVQLLPALIEALGGEVVLPGGAAAVPSGPAPGAGGAVAAEGAVTARSAAIPAPARLAVPEGATPTTADDPPF